MKGRVPVPIGSIQIDSTSDEELREAVEAKDGSEVEERMALSIRMGESRATDGHGRSGTWNKGGIEIQERQELDDDTLEIARFALDR
jgi:hypothetical protein